MLFPGAPATLFPSTGTPPPALESALAASFNMLVGLRSADSERIAARVAWVRDSATGRIVVMDGARLQPARRLQPTAPASSSCEVGMLLSPGSSGLTLPQLAARLTTAMGNVTLLASSMRTAVAAIEVAAGLPSGAVGVPSLVGAISAPGAPASAAPSPGAASAVVPAGSAPTGAIVGGVLGGLLGLGLLVVCVYFLVARGGNSKLNARVDRSRRALMNRKAGSSSNSSSSNNSSGAGGGGGDDIEGGGSGLLRSSSPLGGSQRGLAGGAVGSSSSRRGAAASAGGEVSPSPLARLSSKQRLPGTTGVVSTTGAAQLQRAGSNVANPMGAAGGDSMPTPATPGEERSKKAPRKSRAAGVGDGEPAVADDVEAGVVSPVDAAGAASTSKKAKTKRAASASSSGRRSSSSSKSRRALEEMEDEAAEQAEGEWGVVTNPSAAAGRRRRVAAGGDGTAASLRTPGGRDDDEARRDAAPLGDEEEEAEEE